MRNFQLIAHSVDVIPLMNALAVNRHLWNQNTLRTQHPMSPHQEVDDIWIRFDDLEEYKNTGKVDHILDQYESVWYDGVRDLPQVRPLIFDLMRRVEASRIGRVLITRLAPGKRISAHVDGGDHAAYYERYHVVLQGLPGSLFRAGDETVTMHTGQVWWFDNAQEHEVVNNSADDRIHLIIDLRVDG